MTQLMEMAARNVAATMTEEDRAVWREVGALAVALQTALEHIKNLDLMGYEEPPTESGHSLKMGPVTTHLTRFGETSESVHWGEFRFELRSRATIT